MTATAKKRLPAITLAAGLILAIALGFYFYAAPEAAADASAKDTAADAKDAKTEDREDKDDEKAPVPVEATEVATGRVSSYISATANLVPENEVSVLAEWEGRVASLKVEEGDQVAKGAVLVGLDPQDGEILRSKAKVKAETEKLAFERAKRLVDQELLSREEFDKMALQHEIAEQELAEAEWKLEKTLIRSPFSGRVTGRMVQMGQHVRRGDQLFTIADFDPLVARIYLPEKDVLTLGEGRKVKISLRADENVEFAGRIRQISPVVDTATGTVKVTVEATSVPPQVRPGAFVRIDVVRDSVADAVLVPREAVVRELQKAYVFVATDGVAEKREVSLGIEEDGLLEASSGVAAGEKVIVAGQGGLKDGTAVKLIGEAGEETKIADATPAS
jgi:membrane fusion protein (multidrug efflux system)